VAQVFISVGSNLNKSENIKRAVSALSKILGELKLSRVYESKSVGFDGENFFNLVVAGTTDQEAADIFDTLRQIESNLGRDRKCPKFSDRTIDLDLLTYDSLIIDSPVKLPRDEIDFNAFVLWPLAEIASDINHPVHQKSYGQMWQEFDKDSQHIWPVEFDFKAK